MMKRSIFLAGLFVLISLLISATTYSGNLPAGIQGAFYKGDYSCIYLNGSNEDTESRANIWRTYTMPINKKNIGYDGMNGAFKSIELLRIKVNTEKPGEEIAVYIDNVTIRNKKGEALFVINFNNGDTGSAYFSQGKALKENGMIQNLDGEDCFLLHAKSQEMYGYSGVEVQFSMPSCPDTKNGKWDFKKQEYTLEFDYYFGA